MTIITMKGELVVVRAAKSEYQELGRATVLQRTLQGPSIANGRLYARDDQHIICLDVRAK